MNVSVVLLLVVTLSLRVCDTSAQKVVRKSERSSFLDRSIFGKPQVVVCNNKTESRVDKFVHSLVAGRFPTNSRELRHYCNTGIKSARFVLGFIKHCLDDFVQKAIQVVFFPLTNEIGKICKSGRMSNKARELVKAGRCGNAARPGLAKCYHHFIEKQLSINHHPDDKMKIPMLCCEFNIVKECFKTEAEEVKSCSKKSIDFVERYAMEMFGEILNLMCYDYLDSSDRCERVIKQIPEISFEGIEKPKSFVLPILDILRDISGEI